MKNINITEHNVSDFIAKEIEGSASPLEILAIKEWVNESEGNKRFYDEMIKVDEMYTSEFSEKIDTQQAWVKVKNKMDKGAEHQPKGYFTLRNILGYAAAIGVLMVASITLLQQEKELPNLLTSNSGFTYELEDGSKVQLDKNSALSQLSKEERTYSFSGKAEFEIVHDDANPFQVNINDIRVRDLGTVFEIKALPGNDTVFVNVDEGLVQFFTLTNTGIFLKEGEEGMYIKSKNKFFKRSIDFKNPLFNKSFEDADMGDVIEHLAYSFRMQILTQIENEKNCNITVDFSDASFAEVKGIIEETLDLVLTENESGLLISGSCSE